MTIGCLKSLWVLGSKLAFVFYAAQSLGPCMPLGNSDVEDEADKMLVDREFAAVTGGSGQFSVSHGSPMVEDATNGQGRSPASELRTVARDFLPGLPHPRPEAGASGPVA